MDERPINSAVEVPLAARCLLNSLHELIRQVDRATKEKAVHVDAIKELDESIKESDVALKDIKRMLLENFNIDYDLLRAQANL